jgi:hypothetical protein
MRMQTWLGSSVETMASTAIGFLINWTANMLILPMFGFPVTGGQAFGIGVIFTVISVLRGLAVRRLFNGIKAFNKPA